MENELIKYQYTQYVIMYEFLNSSGENTERYFEFEPAVNRVRELYKKGCYNITLYKERRTDYNITYIIRV